MMRTPCPMFLDATSILFAVKYDEPPLNDSLLDSLTKLSIKDMKVPRMSPGLQEIPQARMVKNQMTLKPTG